MLPGGFSESGGWPSCLLIHPYSAFLWMGPTFTRTDFSNSTPDHKTQPCLLLCVCVHVHSSICLSIPPSVLPVSVVMVSDFDVEVFKLTLTCLFPSALTHATLLCLSDLAVFKERLRMLTVGGMKIMSLLLFCSWGLRLNRRCNFS